jgi:uncharacterized membrane protein YfcA
LKEWVDECNIAVLFLEYKKGDRMSVWWFVPLALVAEYVDSTLGMGYGTSLTPILLLFGYSPAQVVPAVLLSELVTGLLAASMHHSVGNVDFRRGSKDRRVALVLSLMSLIGAVAAVFLAVRLPIKAIKLYIATIVIVMGLLILLRRRRSLPFSWRRLVAIGSIAAFNKGISGGGYGPLVTAGQIVSGVGTKNAIGITSLAEGITCAVGAVTFLFLCPETSNLLGSSAAPPTGRDPLCPLGGHNGQEITGA